MRAKSLAFMGLEKESMLIGRKNMFCSLVEFIPHVTADIPLTQVVYLAHSLNLKTDHVNFSSHSKPRTLSRKDSIQF